MYYTTIHKLHKAILRSHTYTYWSTTITYYIYAMHTTVVAYYIPTIPCIRSGRCDATNTEIHVPTPCPTNTGLL